MKTTLQRLAAAVVLVTSGACWWRAEPTRPAPEPAAPPTVSLPEPEPEPEPAQVLPAGAGLLAAEAVWLVGRPLDAEALLGEVHRTARQAGQTRLAARALVLQSFLLRGRNAPEEADELLRRAVDIDPHGPSGRVARLTLDTVILLGERERELERVRSQLAAAEQDRDDRAAEQQKLVDEMAALREQLDTLKKVHLETESEKEPETDSKEAP